MVTTDADCNDLEAELNFRPKTDIQQGLKNFVKWYLDFYDD